ncbi:MAG: CHAT domain-containing protein [Kiritimatiellae bacterium]|nr:CHAT domain-containing protein [Kiritimatiellia bacterium]
MPGAPFLPVICAQELSQNRENHFKVGLMDAMWTKDPLLKGKFHPEHPECVQVLIHASNPRFSGKRAELAWVRVTESRGQYYIGSLVSPPKQLDNIRQGDEVLFMAVPSGPYPFLISADYLEDRKNWIISPCSKCGFTEMFQSPTKHVEALMRQDNVPEGKTPIMLATSCPICGGIQMLGKVGTKGEQQVRTSGANDPDKKTKLPLHARLRKDQDPLSPRWMCCTPHGAEHRICDMFLSMGYLLAQEDSKQALQVAEDARNLTRRSLGRHHPLYASCLRHIGEIHLALDSPKEAERFFREGLALQKELQQDPYWNSAPLFCESAETLHSLGRTYHIRGRYSKAEELLQAAQTFLAMAPGVLSVEYAVCAVDLADLYHSLGNFRDAELLYLHALIILKLRRGGTDPAYAACLSNIGKLYHDIGDVQGAYKFFRRTRRLKGRTVGTRSPSYAVTLLCLAQLRMEEGKYWRANRLCQRAMSILVKTVGNTHRAYISCQNDCGVLNMYRGNVDKAEQLLTHVLKFRLSTLGPMDPKCMVSMENLASLYAATRRAKEATRLLMEAEEIRNQLLDDMFSVGSARERIGSIEAMYSGLCRFLTLVFDGGNPSEMMVQEALTLVLRRKCIEAEAMLCHRENLAKAEYREETPFGLAVQLKYRKLARKRIGLRDIAVLLEEGTRLATRIAIRANTQAPVLPERKSFSLKERILRADTKTVSMMLPEDTCLVEYIRFSPYQFRVGHGPCTTSSDTARYLAFVVLSGDGANARMIDLGNAKDIEQLIGYHRTVLFSGSGSRVRRRGFETVLQETENEHSQTGTRVREKVFDPIVPYLNGRTKLVVAPAGAVSVIPFGILPLGAKEYLVDKYSISYVATGRDVLRSKPSCGSFSHPVVVADPDFDLCMTAEERSDRSPTTANRRESQEEEKPRMGFRGLQGTREEGAEVARMLRVEDPWFGERALKTPFKSLASPIILHVATHGFFRPSRTMCASEKQNTRKKQQDIALSLYRLQVENPLISCGLALAGANTWTRGGSVPKDAEDGIITAEDAAQMDLLGTDLVVLSACDTGLGAIHVEEGVLGLGRSFILAGSRTVVMSMWKIPDPETKELMTTFYEGILAGRGKSEALREAQLVLKEKYSNPSIWGSFICQGDSGPLPETYLQDEV